MKKEVKEVLQFCETLKSQAKNSLKELVKEEEQGLITKETAKTLRVYDWGKIGSLNTVIDYINALYEEE